ncbi:MAG: SUMF1/EgtB/PvdO family nonheme iron enzyme [Culturomica sp.]|jgi:uncharacterized protein (TIGR02145 family)|nr:SUMF1/EgtB/PvdO family nonheme iron enzyme [Culturomica sp.]
MNVEDTERGKKRGEINHVFRNFLICACILLSTNVLANNVRFNSKPTVFLSGDSVIISFSLSWDHSWRDDFNWDAVWVFGKYGKGISDNWHHLNLSTSGHIMPSGFTYDVGNIDADNAGGLFLMRADKGSGAVNNQTFTIKTHVSNFNNINAANLSSGDVFLSLSAIEMVYIPYGGYYLGDGATPNRLGGSDGAAIAVNSEDALTVYTVTSGTVGASKSLPSSTSANFPKGYKGFYCMKYEVSQDQYVSFLNSLTRAQQKARIGNNLDELKVGDYVFGDKLSPSYRNGICVISNPAGKPAIFGCNLNPAEPYFGADDGKCIACNYLTPADMLAYCDWACLRPMSELEYEKACRKPYPQAAIEGEFVWNSASGVSGLSGAGALLNAGRVNEQPASGATNVNYNNGSLGPVRSASFGTSSSTQAQAGATFWGLMEMSGNVAELCYSVNAATTFNTYNIYASHGNGEVNPSGATDIATTVWSNAAASFIAKGGSFASTNTTELAISDRTRATVSDVRDSTVGFRAVHTFGGSSVTVDAGEIFVPVEGCATGITVSNTTSASVLWNGAEFEVPVNYVWYVKEGAAGAWSLIPDETGADLNDYKPSLPSTGIGITVWFKRKAVTSLGEAESAEISTTVPNLNITFEPSTSKLDACGAGSVRVSVPYNTTTPVFTWTTETGNKTGVSYTPEYTDFTKGTLTNGDVSVTCLVEVSGCTNSKSLTVSVTPLQPRISFTCGSIYTDTREVISQDYPTVLIGDQCWMTKNMNIGTRVAGSDYNTHQTAGIQKICYDNLESNCDIYGGLYSWAEAVNGEQTASGAINTATDFNKKCAVDGSGHTQGICPDGWHVPSDAEFKTLEMALDPPLTQAQADATIWRGSDQGRQLKSIDLWTYYDASTTGTNTSFWDGRSGGDRVSSGGTFSLVGTHGFWWSSSEYSSSNAWRRHLDYSYATVYRDDTNKSRGFSVRCLLN